MRHLHLAPDQEGRRERILHCLEQLCIATGMILRILADEDQDRMVGAPDPDTNEEADANGDQVGADANV